MYNIAKAVLIILCIIFLYQKFCCKPKIKIIKIPTSKEIKLQRKRKRRMRRIKRRFKIPYIGKTQIIKYDKTKPYIESAWDEVQKAKK